MSRYEANADEAERKLADSLANLERRVQEALGEELPLDPERLLSDLGAQARELNHLVRQAERVLTRPDPDAVPVPAGGWSVRMHDLVRDELGAVLTALKFPVVCKTRFDAARMTGAVEEGPQKIRAALRRALMLGCSYAGPGGDVQVQTGELDDLATFELSARPAGELGDSLAGAGEHSGVDLRSRSLTEFVGELGGQLEVVVDDGRLRIAVDFGRAVG